MSSRIVDLTTYSECSCANCGFVIDYRASRAGEVIECPKCGVQSRLPEPRKLGMIESFGPPLPTLKNCGSCQSPMPFSETSCPECETTHAGKRFRKKIMIGISGTATACLLGLIISITHAKKVSARSAQTTANSAHGTVFMESAKTSAVSQGGLKSGKFDLQPSPGSDLMIAVGDIENASENVRRGLKADVDLYDRQGVRIGTVSDYISELAPHQSWHFLTTVDNPNACRARLAQITENN